LQEDIMDKISSHRLLMPMIIAALVLAACGAPTPTAAPAQPSPASTRAAVVDATQAAIAAPTLIPTRVVTRSEPAQPDASQSTATPSPVGQHSLNGIDVALTLNADGTASLDAPSLETGAAARSWRGVWLPETDQGIIVRLNTTAEGVTLLAPVGFQVSPVTDTWQIDSYIVGSASYSAPEVQSTFGSGQRHPLIAALNNLLAQVPYLNYTNPLQDSDLYSDDVRRAVVRFQETEGLYPTGVADQRTWLELLSPPYADVPTTTAHFIVTEDVVNLRSGPATDYPAVHRAQKDDTLDIAGKISGSTPETTWYEVHYAGQETVWARSDTGRTEGPIETVAEVPADQLPPKPTPAPVSASGGTSISRRGQPLLENLPNTAPDGSPIVYLTFDDGPNVSGPNGGYTEEMLALLKQYNGHATFFNVGKSVSAWPEEVRAVVQGGHYVANHTWDHSALAGLTKEEFVAEAERTKQAIIQAAGDLFSLDKDVRYLRPPYGSTDANTRQYAADLGYATVLWDVDPQDWRRPGTEAIADHILSHVFPGAIVLMHDGGGDRSQSVAALEIILRELSAKGYKFYNIFGN
jgi:peptidoglycan/xylan/chitin deacetylase (PgdA/CDA1 family)